MPPNSPVLDPYTTAKVGADTTVRADQTLTTPFTVAKLKYPLDLTTQTSEGSIAGRYRHWIDFRIQVQEKSKFKPKEGTSVSEIDLPGNRITYDPNAAVIGAAGAATKFGDLATAAAGTLNARSPSRKAAARADLAYKAASTGTGAAGLALADANLDLRRKTVQTKALISLYTPDQIVYKTENDYDQIKVSEKFGKAAQIAISPGNYGIAAAAGLNGGDTDSIYRLLLNSDGYVQNPALEVLYGGSKFRTFQFVFDFSPRDKKEEQEIKNIIQTFRFHAAPEFSGAFLPINGDASNKSFTSNGTLLIPPSEFVLEFMMSDKDGNTVSNPSLPKIKQCVLTSMDVDYSPDSHFSAHRSGHPVHIRATMNFLEVQILTKSDILGGY